MKPINYVPKNSRLSFIKDLGKRKYGDRMRNFGLYKCKCGNICEVLIRSVNIGCTKSCGCLRRERMTKHGYRHHLLYSVWYDMKSRCYDKNDSRYEDWGGRGIKVCDEWKNDIGIFIRWALSSWKKGLQIDRRNNDGNYCPENCRFVTRQMSICNTRLLRKDNTSGYRGVICNNGKWEARISINNKTKHLGLFGSPRLAALRYDIEAYRLDDGRPRNLF
jgi:hypothetical protein